MYPQAFPDKCCVNYSKWKIVIQCENAPHDDIIYRNSIYSPTCSEVKRSLSPPCNL